MKGGDRVPLPEREVSLRQLSSFFPRPQAREELHIK